MPKLVQLIKIHSLALVLLAIHLAACGGGSPNRAAQNPANTPGGPAPDAVTITGIPPVTAAAGQIYSFAPSGSDNLGKALVFSVANAPAWATFDTTTGTLSGTPASTQAGTYADVVISASDGAATASLTAFTITVTNAGAASSPSANSATLTWSPSRDNTNGTVLADLGGYYIYYGTSADALTRIVSVATGANSFTIDGLSPGTQYYFSIAAFNSAGQQSAGSEVVSKTI